MATPHARTRPLLPASPASPRFAAPPVRVWGLVACLSLAPLLAACSSTTTTSPPTSGAPAAPATTAPALAAAEVQKLRTTSASVDAHTRSLGESANNQDRVGFEATCGDLAADTVSLRAPLPTGNARVDQAADRLVRALTVVTMVCKESTASGEFEVARGGTLRALLDVPAARAELAAALDAV